jgi:hypothetical protein
VDTSVKEQLVAIVQNHTISQTEDVLNAFVTDIHKETLTTKIVNPTILLILPLKGDHGLTRSKINVYKSIIANSKILGKHIKMK